jgi:hypothetical protein
MHSSQFRNAFAYALLALVFTMDNRVFATGADSTHKLLEHPNRLGSRQTNNKPPVHEDVAPPEPESTKKRLLRGCPLFSDYALLQTSLTKTFDLLDKDHDGRLTKMELASQINDRRLNPIESGLLAGFYENFDDLSGLSRIFWFGEKFDRKTLQSFLEIVKKSEPPLLVARQARYWTESPEAMAIGLDFEEGCYKNSLLEKSRDPHLSATAQKNIEYLLHNFESVSVNHLCTSNSVKHYYWQLRRSTLDYRLTFYVEDSMETSRVLAMDKPSQNLYWHSHDPLLDIRADNIIQGNAGDCTFKSVLCGVANTRPDQIVRMIRQTGKDTFSVTFPGCKPINVKAPSWAEQVLYEPDCHSGIWQNLLEQAYGSLKIAEEKHSEYTPLRNDYNGLPVEEKTALLYDPRTAIKVLTGHASKFLIFANVNELDTMKALRSAFSGPQKPIVIAGTQEPRDKLFEHNHSYLVEGISGIAGSKQERVVVRNTHGFNDVDDSTVLSITPHQFWENFNDATIEEFK